MQEVQATGSAFAAILEDTSEFAGGDSSGVEEQLRSVKQIQVTGSAYACS